MTDAGYVFLGWAVTGAAIAAYAARLFVRARNAARSLPEGETPPWR